MFTNGFNAFLISSDDDDDDDMPKMRMARITVDKYLPKWQWYSRVAKPLNHLSK